jgi:hypothetical protein
MTTPPAPPPGPPHGSGAPILLTKPGTITAAQVMLWLQFSTVVCCGAGAGLSTILSAELSRQIRSGLNEFGLDAANDALSVVLLAATVALVLLSILIGVVAAKIGAGLRSAQVVAILLMLAFLLPGCVGVYGLTAGADTSTGAVSTPAGLFALLWLAMPAVTILCLVTGSANQWFRQRGWDPVRPRWYPQPPLHH